MLTVILVVATLITLVLVLRARRSLRLDIAGWYIVVVGVLPQLPTAAAKFTGSFEYSRAIDGELLVDSLGWADQLYRVSDFGVLIATVLLLFRVRTAHMRFRVSLATILLFGLVATGMVANLLVSGNLPTGQPWLLLLAIVVTGCTATSFRSIAAGGAIVTLFMSIGGALLAVAKPAAAFGECLDKCTWIGEVFSGISSHGNALAIILTLGVPFVWFAFTGIARVWISGYVLFLVSVSGSRTSFASAVVVLLVLIVTRVTLKDGAPTGRAQWFGTTITIAVGAFGFILPFVVTDNLFATGRGFLWQLAIRTVADSPIVGMGAGSWEHLFAEGLIVREARYATHNQWLEAVFVAGTIGAMLFTAAMMTLLFTRNRSERATATPIILAIFALGILERPIGIDLVAGTSWALFGLLMLTNATPNGQWASIRSRRFAGTAGRLAPTPSSLPGPRQQLLR